MQKKVTGNFLTEPLGSEPSGHLGRAHRVLLLDILPYRRAFAAEVMPWPVPPASPARRGNCPHDHRVKASGPCFPQEITPEQRGPLPDLGRKGPRLSLRPGQHAPSAIQPHYHGMTVERQWDEHPPGAAERLQDAQPLPWAAQPPDQGDVPGRKSCLSPFSLSPFSSDISSLLVLSVLVNDVTVVYTK